MEEGIKSHSRDDFEKAERSLAEVQAERKAVEAQIAELQAHSAKLAERESALQESQGEMMGAAKDEADADNAEFDADKARVAEVQAAALEAAKQDKLAELRAKIKVHGESEDGAVPQDDVEGQDSGSQEKPEINPIEINNRIIRIEKGSKRQEALDALTSDEIDAIAEMISNHKTPDDIMRNLDVFAVNKGYGEGRGIKPEIAGHPIVAEALKRVIQSNAWVYLYDIQDIMHNIPDSEKIFEDEKVREKLVQSAISEMQDRDPGARENFLKIIGEIQFTQQELRTIAEGLKMDNDRLAEFVNHFGAKTIYPEMQ